MRYLQKIGPFRYQVLETKDHVIDGKAVSTLAIVDTFNDDRGLSAVKLHQDSVQYVIDAQRDQTYVPIRVQQLADSLPLTGQ